MSKFDIMETTVAKVQAAYLDGSLTCRELCEQYIARIKAYDHEGPAGPRRSRGKRAKPVAPAEGRRPAGQRADPLKGVTQR